MLPPHISEGLWPARMKPKEDELLSSWLVRLAMAHGLKLHTFCVLAWPGKSIWNRDLDKSADSELLDMLVSRTGYTRRTIDATTLADYEGKLYEKHNPFGNTLWVMPLGIYHRTRTQFGLQFCPDCFHDDKEPYCRRKWRLAFVTVCEKHYKTLVDRCSYCGQAINFYRDEMGVRHKVAPSTMTGCHKCGNDLRCINASSIPRALVNLVNFQKSLLLSLQEGWRSVPGRGYVCSNLYFTALHQVMRLLATGRQSKVLRDLCCRESGIESFAPAFPKKSRHIERLSISERQILLHLSYWLLDEWPYRFVRICRDNNIWSSTLLRDLERAPFWYWSIVHEYLYRESYSPSDQEIESVISSLRKRGEPVNKKSISRCLGVSDTFRKRARGCFNFLKTN